MEGSSRENVAAYVLRAVLLLSAKKASRGRDRTRRVFFQSEYSSVSGMGYASEDGEVVCGKNGNADFDG